VGGISETSNLVATGKASHLAVARAIADALQREATIDANNIVVNCDGDDVWLRGHVQSWAAYFHAEAAARATPGVSSVHNDVRLRMPPPWSCHHRGLPPTRPARAAT
jgi:osmotically-inducible protein OsmY